MRKTIQKFAYKLCSTEVKMLIDKLEENSSRIGLTVLGKELRPSHGFLHITNTGKFSIVERIAIASKLNEIHRKATKLAIVETIFEGEARRENREANLGKPFPPTKTITTRDISEQAHRILTQEIQKNYNAHINEHVEIARKEGLI